MKHSIYKMLFIGCMMMLVFTGCSKESSNSDTSSNTTTTTEEEQIALVENDRYVEPLNPTNAQIEAYNLLSEAVELNDAQEEAKQVAISFIYDFFTLSNKESNEDVGGLQFIPSVNIRSFMAYAKAYYYSNYGTIVNEYSEDALPQVSEVTIQSMEARTLTYSGQYCDGYVLEVSVSYESSDLDESLLKTDMTISVVALDDYDFDRSYDYTDSDLVFEGELNPCYRVISVA